MNDTNTELANQTRRVAEDQTRVVRAIRALERAQIDADQANEIVNRAREEAKSAQRAVEESLAALKAMIIEAYTVSEATFDALDAVNAASVPKREADAASKIGKTGLRVGTVDHPLRWLHGEQADADDMPRTETTRIVIEADTAQATTALKDTAGALDAVTAAANAASAALDNLPKREADGLMFTIDLDADGGLPHVSISGPCELLATHNRLGVEGIVDVAKRAQRALYQAIVDKPEAE